MGLASKPHQVKNTAKSKEKSPRRNHQKKKAVELRTQNAPGVLSSVVRVVHST
jgi:hypothetical protein